MPQIWDKDISRVGVMLEELVPDWFVSYNSLKMKIKRTADQAYGIKRLQRGGGEGNIMLIDFDTLDYEIQQALGDPRRKDHILENWYQTDAAARSFYSTYLVDDLDPSSYLKHAQQQEYILNASVLMAVDAFKKAHIIERSNKGKKPKSIYKLMLNECNTFNEVLKVKHKKQHTLPKSIRQFRTVYDNFFLEDEIDFVSLLHGNLRNNHAKKTGDTAQEAVLRRLLSHANNFNYAQVQLMYNEVASNQDWKPITRKTVETFAKKNKLMITPGRRGQVAFDTNIAMQHKRKAIAYPMLLWSLDGWDVELMYQKTETNAKGHSVTTYTNRPTVVVVLDPYTAYPIGYAIGTHESPALIKEAVRNAINHTAMLFGDSRYIPQQVQSDRYALKTLQSFYENASAKAFTPARVKNAKAKPVERYFANINTNYCQFLNNWSGHNVTARAENQPNADWKNKVRHSFPDWDGVVMQITTIIEQERGKKRAAYLEGWQKLPEHLKKAITTEYYLLHLGETKKRTTQLRGEGLQFTLDKARYTYDSFDMQFREYAHIDWQVHYDPQDMELVLATNPEGNIRFLLEEKQAEAATLTERTSTDQVINQNITQFNKQLKEKVLTQQQEDYDAIGELMEDAKNAKTLAKMVLVDSMGQHKNQRNKKRIAPAPQKKRIKQAESTAHRQRYDDYLDSKVNIENYI